MSPQAASLEQRLDDLEAQMKRLALALERRREDDERYPFEQRLALITEQWTDTLNQWNAINERHAQAVGELESQLAGWNDIEARLQHDASSRFEGLERAIAREWTALRRLHEEPVRELRHQAETLTEISVNAAGSAQTGIERAEARLSALEHDLHGRMDDLARDIHAVLAELRQQSGPAQRTAATSWSLDEVTRLHQELRGSGAAEDSATALDVSAPRSTVAFAGATARVLDVNADVPSGTATRVVQRAESDAFQSPGVQELDSGEAARPNRSKWKWYGAVAALIVALGAGAAFALSFYDKANQAAARASEAQQHAERIAAAASASIEQARQDAAAQITHAREAASKAQVTTDVLAASDLVRFNLSGGDGAARILAQLLWSRSRGMVFTASRMPTPASGSIYQIWLLTAGAPVSAGAVMPDASGRIAFATDTPPTVPRPIIGVRVTAEPAPGSSVPSDRVVLGRTP